MFCNAYFITYSLVFLYYFFDKIREMGYINVSNINLKNLEYTRRFLQEYY